MERVLFLSKGVHKRLRGWALGRNLHVHNFVECPSFQAHPTTVALRGSQRLNLCLREIENGGAGTRVWNGSALYHSSPENIDMFGLHEVDETYRTALLNFPAVCSLRCKSVRSRFPDEMTQWTRWELVLLGLATVKRVTTTCKPFSNIVAK